MNCIECEHFHISDKPIKAHGGGYWELGHAICDKHPDMIAEYGSMAWLKNLKCMDKTNGDSL